MLDTNMCIYIIKKKTEYVLKELQNKRKAGLAISTITLAELEYGNENSQYKEKNKIALMQFLTIIDVKPFDGKASKEFGKIKKDLKDRKCLIGPYDMLIGAHAKSLGLILVTNNVKEFERIADLRIENWV
ncbi:MAG: type II toxin-antitoxin system VapC family toxin [Spirochaetaceae bacterium]|jgi:tRNA(fMet)-specific endonuclease VapC|nr:type II toxin-antitoxin system VapC family toxin [Spirochaetaceae bacterium]